MKQCDLSQGQARCQEFLSQYNFKIVYICGKDNTVADALPRLSQSEAEKSRMPDGIVAPVFTVSADKSLTCQLQAQLPQQQVVQEIEGESGQHSGREISRWTLYWKDRLMIPQCGTLNVSLFCLAHDTLGHFGSDKS